MGEKFTGKNNVYQQASAILNELLIQVIVTQNECDSIFRLLCFLKLNERQKRCDYESGLKPNRKKTRPLSQSLLDMNFITIHHVEFSHESFDLPDGRFVLGNINFNPYNFF